MWCLLFSFALHFDCKKGDIRVYEKEIFQNTTHVGCGWSQFQYRGFAVSATIIVICLSITIILIRLSSFPDDPSCLDQTNLCRATLKTSLYATTGPLLISGR